MKTLTRRTRDMLHLLHFDSATRNGFSSRRTEFRRSYQSNPVGSSVTIPFREENYCSVAGKEFFFSSSTATRAQSHHDGEIVRVFLPVRRRVHTQEGTDKNICPGYNAPHLRRNSATLRPGDGPARPLVSRTVARKNSQLSTRRSARTRIGNRDGFEFRVLPKGQRWCRH